MLTQRQVQRAKPVRYGRKFSDGGGLFLLVTPQGARCWRYSYRVGVRQKTLALGIYPDVSLEKARARHQFARSLLAQGIDPAVFKASLGKHAFVIAAREWVNERDARSIQDSGPFPQRIASSASLLSAEDFESAG